MTRMTEDLALNMIRDSYNFTSNVLFSGEQRLCSYIAQGAYKDFFLWSINRCCRDGGNQLSAFNAFIEKKLAEDNILKKENGGFQIIDMTQLKARSAEGIQAR